MSETSLNENLQPFFDYFSYLENSISNFNSDIDDSILFRNWIDFINNSIENDLNVIMKNGNPNFKNYSRATAELKEYLMNSFGSYDKHTYDCHNELNFFIFIYCLCKLNIY